MAASESEMPTTVYVDTQGRRYVAVELGWDEVERVLGHKYALTRANNERLVEHLIAQGAPAWVRDVGLEDEHAWAEGHRLGIVGPEIPADGPR